MTYDKQFTVAYTIIFHLTTLSVPRTMERHIAACTVSGASQRLQGGIEYNHDN